LFHCVKLVPILWQLKIAPFMATLSENDSWRRARVWSTTGLAASKPTTMMRSVQRILAVFESFTTELNSLTLQEIADRIELPKSTAFRIVQSLEKAGYLVRLEDQRYCLSFRFTRLAGLVKSTLGIREIARPLLSELAQKTQETVSIHTIVGRNRVCIDAMSAAVALRSVILPGEEVPLQKGSATKILVAYMQKKEAAPLIASMARSTQRTQAEVREELIKIRKQGWAISHGERLLGVSAISAPVVDVQEQIRYCLSIGGPSVRMQMHEKDFIKLAVDAAKEISLQLGAPPGGAGFSLHW
jgi:DNA-binding IclR family transcriptional regulator